MGTREIVEALLRMGFGHFGKPGYSTTVFGPDGQYKVGASEHLRYPPAHQDPWNMHDKVGSVWVHPLGILVASGRYVPWLNELGAANLETATSPTAGRRYPGWRDHTGDRVVTRLLEALAAALLRMAG